MKSSSDRPIDAISEFEERERSRIEGERDTSGLASDSRFTPRGGKLFFAFLVLAGCATAGAMLLKASNAHESNITQDKIETAEIRNNLPVLIPPPPPAPPPMPSEVRNEHSYVITSDTPADEKSPEELLYERRLTSGLQGTASNGESSHKSEMLGSMEQGGGDLSSQLQPMRLKAAIATTLSDRNYLLTAGSTLDCVLETRIISTVPGLTTCYLTRNIYSANGEVVLLDRGSKVIGHYEGGMRQGQARIFVTWGRIETPDGVIINLDSPGTGPLGEAGLGGHIDTHFMERFGGAIMLSLIGDFADFAANQGNDYGDNNQVTFSNTSDAAQEMAAVALENTINIPPTLYKNQGDHIAIKVARDLDFRDVYDLSIIR